jgi:hypothetical protein
MYYPKSQITPNLYTNGEEFVFKTNLSPYKGYYFKTSKGEYFTGRNQNDLPNEPLIPQAIPDSPNLDTSNPTLQTFISQDYDVNVLTYIALKNPNLITTIPQYSPTIPTLQDYQNNEFRRYFAKKTNELTYVEISKSTYEKLINKDPQIEFSLYFGFNIPWSLTGDKQKVAQTNKNIVEIAIKRQKLYKFDEYLKQDYLKYYQ